MALKMQLKNIPQNPGVYCYRNASGTILYVGKANNLRARLRSYFAKNAPEKVRSLVQEAHTLTWEIVNSETEALVHESELIKKYRPKYNILMRDDKNYLYAAFSNEKYPRIFLTHQPRQNYIGPFTDSTSLKSTLKMLRKIFPYCTCKTEHKTPCLNAKIGRCPGYCCLNEDGRFSSQRVLSPERAGSRSESAGLIPERASWGERGKREDNRQSEYKNNISAIKKILSGKNKSLLRSLTQEMKKLSHTQHYEEAGHVRDQINALERIFEHKSVIKKDMPSDRQRALNALADILKIKEVGRIEGYDISNIHGNFAYGSMVVFVDGMPAKDEYRIFKIKTVRGSDDPRMIGEVVSRRLRHAEWKMPEVMLIDGGPTQLNEALRALRKNKVAFERILRPFWHGLRHTSEQNGRNLGASRRTSENEQKGNLILENIKIISLAKREEELYLPNHKQPIKIKESSEALYSLLTHIRDEAHRFAISHYRQLHRKKFLE